MNNENEFERMTNPVTEPDTETPTAVEASAAETVSDAEEASAVKEAPAAEEPVAARVPEPQSAPISAPAPAPAAAYYAPYVPAYMPPQTPVMHPVYPYAPYAAAPAPAAYPETPKAPANEVKSQTDEPKPKKERRKKSGRGITALTLVFALILSICAGFAAGWGGMMLFAKKLETEQKTADPTEREFNPSVIYQNIEKDEAPAEDGSVKSVANAVQNCVVAITTEVVKTNAFFGQYVTGGAGSGVIVTEDGYIATNNHVVEDGTSYTVTLNDGTSYKAELIGADAQTDLAILKIDATGLTPIIFGNSEDISVGQTVIAIGNPLGTLGGSVTSGIISALERDVTVEGQKMKLMQTDTAVNPGNSGGGLFNLKGELIGIINAKSYGEAIEGIGFAIPSKIAEKSIVELMEFGYVRGRVDLGLEVIDINSAIAAAYYRVNTLGCYIISSAYTDELKQGDRITAVNGNEVSSYADITALLPGFSVGDKVTITVSRNGKLLDVELECREKNAGKGDIDFRT